VLIEEEEEQRTPATLKTLARSLPAQGVMVMTVAAERGRPEGSIGPYQLVPSGNPSPY